MKKIEEIEELRECLELLNAILTIEYHNKNWLSEFLIRNPKILNREKRSLLERAIKIVGSTSMQEFT